MWKTAPGLGIFLMVLLLAMPFSSPSSNMGAGTQERRPPVILEFLGPGSAAQPSSGMPADLAVRQEQYLLRNLSSQDILLYNIVFVSETGKPMAETGRASYPPDQPPAVRAGQSEVVVRRYIDDARTSKAVAQIDCVLFADGSAYGPDSLRRKAAYVATVETQYLMARHILNLLETKGADGVKEYLTRIVNNPSAIMSKTVMNAAEAMGDKRNIKE